MIIQSVAIISVNFKGKLFLYGRILFCVLEEFELILIEIEIKLKIKIKIVKKK